MNIKLKIASFILALSMSMSVLAPTIFAENTDSTAKDTVAVEQEDGSMMEHDDDDGVTITEEEVFDYVAQGESGLVAALREDHEASMDFLIKLGIIQSTDDKDYPVKPISRAEFLSIAMRMIGYNDERVSYNTRKLFFDVEDDHEFAGYISTAYDLGIISAAVDGYFHADRNITCTEAATMILRVLNYNYSAEQNGGYPLGYVTVADRLDLFDNVKADYNDGMSYGDACEMIFNALHTCKVTVIPTNMVTSDEPTEKTVLEYYYNIYKYEGVLSGNSVVRLPAGDGVGANSILVDNQIFTIGEEYDGKYLGYNVVVYYKPNDYNQVLAIYPEKTNIKILNCLDIDEYKPGEIQYFDGSKTVTERLSPYASTILNNTVFTLGADGMTVKDYGDYGTFMLIDNDRDDRYDVVIITNWSTMLISGVDSEKEKIYSKNNAAENIDLSTYSTYRIYDEDMKKIPLTEIMENDLIEYKRSPSGDSIDIVRVKRTCDVKIKLKATENGYLYLTGENNVRYRVSNDFYKYSREAEIFIGQTYTFALNRNDEIACIVKVSSTSMSYGYVVKSYFSDETGEDQLIVKMFTLEEEMIMVKAADKVKIYNSTLGTVKPRALYSLLLKPQLIRFALDEKGMLKTVDIASEDKFSEGFRIVGTVDSGNNTLYNRYKTGSRTVGGQILINDDTTAVGIPTEEYLDDTTEYFISGSAYFASDEYYPGAVAYSADPTSIAAQIVIVPGRNSSVNSANPLMLVTKVYEGISYDGESVQYLKGLMSGKETSYPVKSGLKLEYTTSAYGTIPVEVGDVVQFAVDNKGQISAINIVMDESKKLCYGSTGSGVALANQSKQTYGSVYKKIDKCLFLNVDGIDSNEIFVVTGNTYVYEFDSKGTRVHATISSQSDIVSSEHGNTTPSKVFISTRYSEPKIIVIYK